MHICTSHTLSRCTHMHWCSFGGPLLRSGILNFLSGRACALTIFQTWSLFVFIYLFVCVCLRARVCACIRVFVFCLWWQVTGAMICPFLYTGELLHIHDQDLSLLSYMYSPSYVSPILSTYTHTNTHKLSSKLVRKHAHTCARTPMHRMKQTN